MAKVCKRCNKLFSFITVLSPEGYCKEWIVGEEKKELLRI